jgi:hypothetical protein
MPTPFAPPVILSHNARTELQAFVRAASTPQSLRLRAHCLARSGYRTGDTQLNLERTYETLY